MVPSTEKVLYSDSICTLTAKTVTVRGATKFLGRRVTIDLSRVQRFAYREKQAFPNGQLPSHGIADDGTWFTRDGSRWRRRGALLLLLDDGTKLGFTPAHAQRVRDLLRELRLPESD